jgi:hypothetical protein
MASFMDRIRRTANGVRFLGAVAGSLTSVVKSAVLPSVNGRERAKKDEPLR